ncbi:JmjC domain-containing protein, partial [Streptomyces nigra]
MTEFVRGLSYERFLAEYWRRKPLFVKGGAHDLLGLTLSYEEADAIVERVREQAPDRLAHDPGRIEFVKGADALSPRLARRAGELQRRLGWPRVTFDVSRTHAPGSIGCHFDYDDNFTLQQDGSKIWRIGSPTAVPETDRRRRVLEDPSLSGQFYLTDDYEEFVVEAGDLLYIPLFHPHWGTSTGRSLSLTMTCNLVTPLTELWPLLHEELSGHRAWWHPSPLPAAPDEQALADLLDVLADPVSRRRVLARWQESRRSTVARHRPETSAARQVLGGMLGADRLGFLTRRWADAFEACCERFAGGLGGTRIGVHGLGADADFLRVRSHESDVSERMTALREEI